MEEKKKKPKKPRGKAVLLPGACTACGARCQEACPVDAIEMDDNGAPIIDNKKCIGCVKCVKICPAEAIEMYFTKEELEILKEYEKEAVAHPAPHKMTKEEEEIAAKLAGYKDVWVFIEHVDGKPASVSWELLGAGAELAKSLNKELCAVVIGSNAEGLCKEAFAYGASKAYLIDEPTFFHYRTEPYCKAVCDLVNKYKPEIILMGATGLGRDLAGAVATELATGLTADCTGLAIDDRGFLMQTRPAFGGNIMATIMTERTRPQMSTVRPHVMSMPPRDDSRQGEIVREASNVKEENIAARVLEVIDDHKKGAGLINLSGAEIIVSGGRGMQSKEKFGILEELAKELDAVVGCSRGAVESGFMPVERQVGQTGKTVRPRIYIACGISGAIQHLVGMQDSDFIIAINRDKSAPIFEVATYGIVGDVFQIVPAITKCIKEKRGKKE